jgi:gamma-glutamylcyclotransferase (GGCT)/AIG2-like uncharacterized protein YtfP
VDENSTLFVYGSLVDAAHRAAILGRRVETSVATMRDYERGRGRYYYLRKRLGVATRGLILLNLTPGDLATLDRYEEVPSLYSREKTGVIVESGEIVRCWVYMAAESVRRDLKQRRG